MNLFLQLKVSDENGFETESIDQSSLEMQFLSQCCSVQAEIWKDDSQLGCTPDPDNTLPNLASQNLLFCLLNQF